MKLFNFFFIILLLFSCSKKENDLKQFNGNIVGFDPCSLKNGIASGYVIISSDKKETLLTYNLPDSLYTFQTNYFLNYIETSYFPIAIRYSFPINISYVVAQENQKIYNLCRGDINTSEFNGSIQVIIKKCTKY
jgi:hypothetical protein